MKVIIVGAGGHGSVVADILRASLRAGSNVEPIGFVDDRSQTDTVHGLPMFGPTAQLAFVPHDAVVVAVGDNRTRQRLFEIAQRAGERLVSAVHPSAIVASDVSIGEGSVVCAGAIINPGTVVGPNVIVNTASSLDHHNVVGAHVHVAPGVHTGGDVRIGDGVMLGIGAVVIPGRRLGSWSTIGAGAVVVRDIDPETVVIGVPAAPMRRPVE